MIRRIYPVAKYLKMFGELVLTFVMVLFLANEENGILPAWLLDGFFIFPLKIMIGKQNQCVGLLLYITLNTKQTFLSPSYF